MGMAFKAQDLCVLEKVDALISPRNQFAEFIKNERMSKAEMPRLLDGKGVKGNPVEVDD
jgi:hypothetical protein